MQLYTKSRAGRLLHPRCHKQCLIDGYKTLFEYSAAQSTETPLLVAKGDLRKLMLRVQTTLTI